jgi:predicted GIY-YIG superfamily endonuclease
MPGLIYLIHFDRHYHHSRHYLGFVTSKNKLQARLERHRNNNGAKLLRAVNLAGIGWQVVRTWDGDRALERKYKNRKRAAALCPLCRSGGLSLTIEEKG